MGLQRDTGLGSPGDFSSIKTPHSSLFTHKTEAQASVQMGIQAAFQASAFLGLVGFRSS